MENKNIDPAISEAPPQQLSSQEFQRMLYAWYEDQGLISDLRSYLRVLMIKKLRKTSMGKIENKTNFSLSKQAFNLVIAEHLLKEGCHYTLSIFSTEVPVVANQLPFSLFEAHCGQENEWKFDEECVLNLLELVGISKGSSESLRISELYSRNFGSLLTCLISNKAVNVVPTITNDNENIHAYLKRILSLFGVPQNLIREIDEKIQAYSQKEIERNNLLLKKHQVKIADNLKSQIFERDKELQRLVEEQIALKNKNKKLKNDLKQVKKQIKLMLVQENVIKSNEHNIEEKLHEIAKLEEDLKVAISKDKETCPLNHCTETCKSNIKLNDNLQKEIIELHEINSDKKLEVEKLTSKVNLLLKDLHGCQLKMEFLNSCLLSFHRASDSQQVEDVYPSSEDSSENITEEVLKQVHTKLQELERESDELDVKFKKLLLIK